MDVMEIGFESYIFGLGNRMKMHSYETHRAEFRPRTRRDESEPLREGGSA